VRRFSVSNPFSSGYISDAPSYAVPLDNASFAQDVFAPSGVIRQRRGWKEAGLEGVGLVSNPFVANRCR
jgi:hypothetical protein